LGRSGPDRGARLTRRSLGAQPRHLACENASNAARLNPLPITKARERDADGGASVETLYNLFQDHPVAAFAPAVLLIVLAIAWAIKESSFRSR
jgi:hypothetical protein